MALKPQTWSISGLSVELGIDRIKLGKLMAGLKPTEEGKQGEDRYLMASVVARLMDSGDPDAPQQLDGSQEDARHKKVQADLKELELAKRRGELVEIEDVTEHLNGIVVSVRAKLLGIPKKAAVLVLGEKKATVIQDKLTSLVHEALEDLAGLKRKAAGGKKKGHANRDSAGGQRASSPV